MKCKKYLVMTMYDELQQIIAPNTLSSFEFTKLEELLKDYTEEQILNAYKKVGYKPINYITKSLYLQQFNIGNRNFKVFLIN